MATRDKTQPYTPARSSREASTFSASKYSRTISRGSAGARGSLPGGEGDAGEIAGGWKAISETDGDVGTVISGSNGHIS